MRWSNEEIDFLINNYPVYDSKYCAEKLKRPESSVMSKVSKIRDKFKPPKKRQCKECLDVKNISDFYKRKNGIYGINRRCKECLSIYKKKYRVKNRNNLIEKEKQWRDSNPEKLRRYEKKWKQLNPEKLKIKQQKFRKKYRQKLRIKSANRRNKNLSKHRKMSREYHVKIAKNLNDVYIKRLITKRSSLKPDDITEDLIKTKRLIIKLKRELKNGN